MGMPAARPKRVEATDPELIARIRGGDVSAVGVLYDRYGQDVRRVLGRLGVAPADIDDIVQDTFVELVRCAKNYDGRANAKPWLIGLAINWVRRRRRSVQVLLKNLAAWGCEPVPATPTPEETTSSADAASRARRALDALSEKKREAFVLVVMEGLSGEQVATMLDVPVATVWTRLHHARRELREALQSEEP